MKKIFSLFFVVLPFSSLFVCDAQSLVKPNVIIIFIDDMGYGDLSCYGNTQLETRHIDALARQGTRFTQFYVNAPVCSPSRVSMLTGQYPARHRFYTYLADRKMNIENNMPDFLPATIPTLAKMLHANGYATGHFGKWHLGGGRDVDDAPLPTAYGFDKSFTSFEGLGDRTLHLDDNLNKQSARLGRGNIVEAPQHKQTQLYIDSALTFIKKHRQQPFFLNIWTNDVHDPYHPESGNDQSFSSITANKEQQKFLAVLQELDQQLGRFISELENLDELKNTLILLTSDNGPTDWPRYYKNGGEPPCSAGDLRGRKWSLYEGGIREPFIAVWPGKIPAGKVNNKTVMSVVDLLPTIVNLTHSKMPAGYISDGRDMSAVLLGKTKKTAKDIYWFYNNNPLPGRAENISPPLAIRSGKWKLLMEPDGSNKQLYNIDADHQESINLVYAQKKIAARLSAKLSNWYTNLDKTRKSE